MSPDDAKLSAQDTIRGKLQRKPLAMLRDRERDGLLPTNVRFLFYELVQMAVIAKHSCILLRRQIQLLDKNYSNRCNRYYKSFL